MRRLRKIVAVALVMIMLMTMQQGTFIVLADEAAKAQDEKDKIELPDYIPEDSEKRNQHVKERTDLETESMAVYENEDGSLTVYSFMEPVKYKDENGELKDYDSELKEVKDSDKKDDGYAYEITSSDVTIMMPEDIATDKSLTMEYDKYKIQFKPLTDLSEGKEEDYEVDKKYKAKEEKNSDKKVEGLEYLSSDSSNITYKYYTLNTGIKEEIILEEKPETNIIQFEYKFKNLVPEQRDDGIVLFLDEETKEIVGAMDALYMYDSFTGEHSEEDGHYSENIQLSIEQDKNNKNRYIFTITLDEEFLEDEDTVYPVIVDPTQTLTIAKGTDGYKDTFVSSKYPNNEYYAQKTNRLGYSTSWYKARAYILPGVPSGTAFDAYEIVSATYTAFNVTTYTSTAYVDIYRITESWNYRTINWNNKASYNTTKQATKVVNGYKWYTFDITEMFENWAKYENDPTQGYPNYGFVIKERSENGTRFRSFSAITHASYPAYLTIQYESTDIDAPDNVASLTATATGGALNSGEGSITVEWPETTDNGALYTAGMDEYELKLYEGTVSAGTQVGSTVTIDHDGSSTYSYTFDNLDDNTTYQCTIRAKDNDDNYSGSTQSSTVTLPDRTGPTAPTSFTIDAADWTNDTTPTITWSGMTDDSTGNIDIEYTLDSGTTWVLSDWDGLSSSGTFDASVFTADDEYSIQIRGQDSEGNAGDTSTAVTYKRDVTLPTGEITSPISSQIDDSVEIKGNISDATSDIASWTLEYGSGITPSSWTAINTETITYPAAEVTLASWDTSSLDLGDYTIKLTVTDNAGNETIDSVTVTKHTQATSTAPTLTITSPINEADFTDASQTDITVEYDWSNGDSSTLIGKVYIDGVKADEEATAGSGLSIDVSTFEEGTSHNIFVMGEGTQTECSDTMYETSYADEFGITPIAALTSTVHSQGKIILGDSGGVYLGNGSITSSFTDNIIPGYVYLAELTVNETKPTGTDIAYSISFDDGTTWQSITPNTPVEMTAAVDPYIQIKAELSTTDGTLTPELEDWSIKINSVSGANLNTFTVNLVGVPTNVSAFPNANYMTLVDWDDDINGEGTLYNVYKGTSPDFIPAEDNLAAEDIDQTFWYDYNLIEEEEEEELKFYYKVTALTTVSLIERESISSLPSGAAEVVDIDELDKMLGLQDYWKYSTFRTGSGNGYINVASGNLVYTSVDSVYPGMLLAMTMRRTYNSQSTTKTTLGYGWDFSYNTCLLREYDSNGNELGMILKDGDGSLHHFTADQQDPGNYDAPDGVFMELKYDSTTEGYVITRKDNISYVFDKNMKLVKMTEFDRNYIEFEYYESGRLYRVVNNIGDQVTFFYYQNSDSGEAFYTTNVEEIGLVAQMIDPAGRVYNYEYQSGTGYLISSTQDITGTTSDYTETYAYASGTYSMTSVYDGENKQTQIAYTSDKVSGVVFPVASESYTINYGTNTTTLTDSWGHSTEYDYNASGCVTSITNPLGDETTYTYNSDLLVTGLSYYNYVNGSSTATLLSYTYTYSADGNVSTITDPTNNTTYYDYYNDFNQAGRVRVQIDGSTTATTLYNYDDNNYLTGDSGEGNTGNLLSTTDAEGNTTTYTYDTTYGLLLTATSSLGSKTAYSYNANGWLTEVEQGPSSGTLTTVSKVLEYDSQGNPTKTEDGEGNVTKVDYDELGRAYKTYLPDNTSSDWTDNKYTLITYDMNSNVVSTQGTITPPSGDTGLTTTYEYDDMDRLISTIQDDTTNGLQLQSTVTYDTYDNSGKDCRKVIYTDAEGSQSVEYYDELGRVEKVAISDGTTEIVTAEYEYDKVGNMVSATDGDGVEAEAKYDELNRQVESIIDPTGEAITNSVVYDYVGQVTSTTDGENNTTSYTYDMLGRILTVTQNDGTSNLVTSYTYDASSSYSQAIIKNTVEDANGNIKETHLDAYGNAVVEVNEGDTSTTANMVVSRTYDDNGQVVTMTNADNTTDYYTYDEWGQLTLVRYGSSTSTDNQTTYTYDSQGRMTSMVDRRADADNSSTINEVTTSWSYDILSRVNQLVQDGNEITYEYNDVGQIEDITYKEDIDLETSPTTTLGYTYDEYGRLVTVTKDSDTVRSYTYTTGGVNVDSMIDYLEFDTGGTNELKTEYTYNSAGLVSEIKYLDTNDTEKEKYNYTYDDRGYITQEILYTNYGTASTVTKNYTYDSLGRLTQTVQGSTTTTWTYDDVGNRLTQDDGTDLLEYTYNEFDQLTEIDITTGGTTSDYMEYDYNDRGAQISKEETGGTTTTYTYDAAGNLAKTDDGTDTYKYFFNGQGQRIRQEVNSTSDTTKYYYTGGVLLFTTDESNDKLTENILTLSGSIIASQRFEETYSNNYYFYNYDIRQSTTSIIDDSFNLMQGYSYDEFGDSTVTGDTNFLNEVTFTGAISDDNGLYYMNSRFYDSDSGRFLTQDTYTGNAYEPWSQHLYSYVGNNPINYIDPTGHWAAPALIDGEYLPNVAPRKLYLEVNISVYFDGDDATSEKIQLAFDGFNDWNQNNVFDVYNYCYYNLVVNINIVNNRNEANLIAYLENDNNRSYYLNSLDDVGGVVTTVLPDGTIVPTPETKEIHLFTNYNLDWTIPGTDDAYRKVARHEFGHLLGINDAYPGDGYYADPNASSDSVMGTGWNITPYDLGIIFSENPDYSRTPIS